MVHRSKTTEVTTSVQRNFFVYWKKSIKWYQYLYIYPKSKIVVRTGPAQWSKLRQEHKKWFLRLQWSKVVRKRAMATSSGVNICWIIAVLLRNSEKWHLSESGPHPGGKKWVKLSEQFRIFSIYPLKHILMSGFTSKLN